MRWTSILAIYVLFWTISLFLVLPFGVRTSEEVGEQSQPGHADSAPHVLQLAAGGVARDDTRFGPVRPVLSPITASAGSPPRLDWLNR